VSELDLNSEHAAALLERVKSAYGASLANAVLLFDRLFALRSAWAPGLFFVGGEIDPQLGSHERFSLAGASDSIEGAFAACLGEGIERVSQLEHDGDIVERRPIGEICSENYNWLKSLLDDLKVDASATVDWVAGTLLGTHRSILIPADWCLRRVRPGLLHMRDTALSTGCAAGTTVEAAAVRAILELIERDAAALWWKGGRRARPLAADGCAMTSAVRLLDKLRQGERHRITWILNITSDVGIPVAAALSVDPSGFGLVCGLAARFTLQEAACAAVLELVQIELGLQLTMVKRHQRGDGALNSIDRRRLALASRINAESCDLLHPLGKPDIEKPDSSSSEDAQRLARLAAALAGVGVEVATVNLMRSQFKVPVVKALAPTLQLYPSKIKTARLLSAIAETGGGERWSQGLDIL